MPAFVPLIVLSSLACLALIAAPQLTFLIGIVWGMCLVLGGHFLDRSRYLLLIVLNFMLLLILGSSAALYPMSFFGIPSLVMGLLLNQRKGYYIIQRWGMLAGIIAISLFLAGAYLGAGNQAMQGIEAQLDKYIDESMKWAQDSSLAEIYEERGISQEELQKNIKETARQMIHYLPALYYLECIIGIFLLLLFSSWGCKRRGLSVLQRRPFREEIMPWQMAWVVIAGLSFWLLGRSEMSTLYYAGGNLLLVTLPITAYSGLAGIVFRVGRMKPRSRRWVIALLIIVFLIFSLSIIFFLSLLGIFDSLIDFRKISKPKEDDEQ